MEKKEEERIHDLVTRSVHSRYRPHFGGLITFYGRDNTSPTGVLSIGGCPGTKEYMDLISSIKSSISPLSPTEGL